jgi:DNA polymerase-3 subunit beta
MNTESYTCNVAVEDKPCAMDGLTSYRYPSAYGGYIMIGATSDDNAISETNRSLSLRDAEISKLEIWSAEDERYIPVLPPEPKPEPVTSSHTFVVDVKEFRAALELAVCEKKPNIPVLATVLLSPQGSSLLVTSTDLDKWTLTDVPAMIDDGAEPFTLTHKKTLELLKGETVILKIVSTKTTLSDKFLSASVKLHVGGCEYELASIDPKHFPQAPVVPAFGFDVSGDDLKTSLGRIIPAISTEESRYTLNGALLECDKDKLLLVATDGHRLALDSILLTEKRKGQGLIQREALAWLAKHSSGEMVITFGEEHSFFHVAQTIFITRNLKGQFPNWQAVTPRKDSLTTTALFPSGDELAKTLAKVARMADERSGCVKFRVNGHCVLSASSIDSGSASATLKASINHSVPDTEIVLGFNSAYVADVLKVAGKNPIVLSLKDNQHAGVFTVPALPEYQYVLMPMRV